MAGRARAVRAPRGQGRRKSRAGGPRHAGPKRNIHAPRWAQMQRGRATGPRARQQRAHLRRAARTEGGGRRKRAAGPPPSAPAHMQHNSLLAVYCPTKDSWPPAHHPLSNHLPLLQPAPRCLVGSISSSVQAASSPATACSRRVSVTTEAKCSPTQAARPTLPHPHPREACGVRLHRRRRRRSKQSRTQRAPTHVTPQALGCADIASAAHPRAPWHTAFRWRVSVKATTASGAAGVAGMSPPTRSAVRAGTRVGARPGPPTVRRRVITGAGSWWRA